VVFPQPLSPPGPGPVSSQGKAHIIYGSNVANDFFEDPRRMGKYFFRFLTRNNSSMINP
jgi:hypothetical protein